MSTEIDRNVDRLDRALNGLQSDINELLARYRRVKESRAELLDACRLALGDYGETKTLTIDTLEDMRAAVGKAEQL